MPIVGAAPKNTVRASRWVTERWPKSGLPASIFRGSAFGSETTGFDDPECVAAYTALEAGRELCDPWKRDASDVRPATGPRENGGKLGCEIGVRALQQRALKDFERGGEPAKQISRRHQIGQEINFGWLFVH